jgi:membrane fusion protein, multidrug efflux system
MLHSTMKSRLTGSPMKFRRMFLFVLFLLLVGGLYVWQENKSNGSWIATYAKPTATQAYAWTVDKSENWFATYAKPTVNQAYAWTVDKTRSWFTAFAKPTATGDQGNQGGAESRGQAVHVVAAPVTEATVPILLSGIGTVIPYNTVDTKAQIDGVIMRLNFVEGNDVKIGDALVTIDPTPYEARVLQWQAKKQRATAQLENAKVNLWRDQQLLAKDFATQKQTDAETALVGQYTADIAEADAQIKFAQNQLDNTVIRSPINGRTGIRRVDPGNFIRAADNTNIVTVVQTQPISVIITVPATALAQAGVSSGMVELPVAAYAQDGTTLLDRGKVEVVNNVVDPATGTIRLKADFPNARNKLWPGDFVDCKVEVESRHNGLTIPAAAVEHGPKGDFVWVVNADAIAGPRPVHVKQMMNDVALIDRGLQPEETVVTEGQYYLRSGSRVEIVPELPGERHEAFSSE